MKPLCILWFPRGWVTSPPPPPSFLQRVEGRGTVSRNQLKLFWEPVTAVFVLATELLKHFHEDKYHMTAGLLKNGHGFIKLGCQNLTCARWGIKILTSWIFKFCFHTTMNLPELSNYERKSLADYVYAILYNLVSIKGATVATTYHKALSLIIFYNYENPKWKLSNEYTWPMIWAGHLTKSVVTIYSSSGSWTEHISSLYQGFTFMVHKLPGATKGPKNWTFKLLLKWDK